MVDLEKSADYTQAGVRPHTPHVQAQEPAAPRPAGWMYKQARIGPVTFPWYASPMAQLLIVSFVCFLCPGMFNALSGLGGGGMVNPDVNNSANVALYSTFATVAFFAGTIANRLGIKLTLSFGGLGYCIYASSLLCYDHTSNAGFVIFSGALLGVCAGLLWTAQGAIMMSYPPEDTKGRYISIFWMIFNLGAVLGSLVSLLILLLMSTQFHSLI
jgi:MFS family permease